MKKPPKSGSRREDFNKTGLANCRIHGRHNKWTEKPSNQTMDCNFCACERSAKWRAANKDYQTIERHSFNGCITRILAQAKQRARVKNLPFELDREWVIETIEKQDNKCFYSGIDFSFSKKFYRRTRIYLPSIDQLNAGGGYTKENSRIVLSIINKMKVDLSFEMFKQFCQAVSGMQNKKEALNMSSYIMRIQ